MLVSEIIKDAKDVLGSCDASVLYRRITDAVKLLNHKGIFDASIAEMDLCVCNGCITLPREVGTVLAINSNGLPTFLRDQWYQYHLSGYGTAECTPCGFSDELGEWSTFKDPAGPVLLAAAMESAQDNNSQLRVFGWDEDGKRIYSTDAEGNQSDGFFIPTINGTPVANPYVGAIARIERIQKPVTVGFVKLVAFNSDTLEAQTIIGYYQPTETDPRYRRMRVPNRTWARVKYKKKDFDVLASHDWLNIDNRLALIMALKSVKLRLDGAFDAADAAEAQATRLLNEESESRRPPSPLGPQIIRDEWPQYCGEDRLFY